MAGELILIVEDNDITRQQLTSLVEESMKGDVDVDSAETAAEATIA